MGFNNLISLIRGKGKVYIQPHNIPDPDAIASSYALKELLRCLDIECEIIYVSYIEKTNAINMLEMFQIDMNLEDKDSKAYQKDYIILVDCQVGGSNLSKIEAKHIGVIDHHNDIHYQNYFYRDIRENVGACSTIIASYYKECDILPSSNVASALLYGIMTDTNNLTRISAKEDLDIFYWLYEIADFTKIKNLRMNEIGRKDLFAYAKALEDIEIYKNIGFVHIENCNDSLLGTISDMVYTIEDVSIVVSYATRAEGVKFSIRSGERHISADELVKFIIDTKGVGGGHKEMAGGFINDEAMDFFDNKELDTYIRYRAIAYVDINMYSKKEFK